MASTRKINSIGNYNLEKNENYNFNKYGLYQHSSGGKAYTTNLAGNGLISGKMHGSLLSTNFIDIETMLRGTGTSNLENISNKYQLNLIQNEPLGLFENCTSNGIHTPLITDMSQRPGHHNTFF
jgi:hypothetical protein